MSIAIRFVAFASILCICFSRAFAPEPSAQPGNNQHDPQHTSVDDMALCRRIVGNLKLGEAALKEKLKKGVDELNEKLKGHENEMAACVVVDDTIARVIKKVPTTQEDWEELRQKFEPIDHCVNEFKAKYKDAKSALFIHEMDCEIKQLIQMGLEKLVEGGQNAQGEGPLNGHHQVKSEIGEQSAGGPNMVLCRRVADALKRDPNSLKEEMEKGAGELIEQMFGGTEIGQIPDCIRDEFAGFAQEVEMMETRTDADIVEFKLGVMRKCIKKVEEEHNKKFNDKFKDLRAAAEIIDNLDCEVQALISKGLEGLIKSEKGQGTENAEESENVNESGNVRPIPEAQAPTELHQGHHVQDVKAEPVQQHVQVKVEKDHVQDVKAEPVQQHEQVKVEKKH